MTTLNNPVLQQAEEKVESQLQPKVRADYDKVVVAGLKAGLNNGPKGILAALVNSKQPIQDCVTGAFNLVSLLYKESRGTMPIQALVPGAMTLMLHALDFADRARIVKVGAPELVQATHMFATLALQRFGISGKMLHTAAAKIHGIASDPAQMERLNREAGVSKAPEAAAAAPPAAAPVPTPGAT
jgi:hypothetical protein